MRPSLTAPKRRLAVLAAAACLVVMMIIFRPGHTLLTSDLQKYQSALRHAENVKVTGGKKRPVVVDYALADAKLRLYKKLFANKSRSMTPADPRNPYTVTQWWQAAALIHWFTESKPRYECETMKQLGNWAACMDAPYTITPPCLVYSFGIAFDFSFDDAMAKHGCEVHSFDPSMETEDHKRSDRVWFHNMGLSSRNTDGYLVKKNPLYMKTDQTWKIRTLTSIKEMLGHKRRVIDVLKIDIEGSEWEVLDNLMEAGELSMVRQLSIEFHLFPNTPPMIDYVSLYKIYSKLREDFGYLEYSVSPHPFYLKKGKYNVQGDSQFVNSLFPYPSSPPT
ncbi:methyltransferase-like protein 24 [Elysia marginata]|uniref:Methyltransferase-like protein 24 n=1 Tax=Elysia marginata TaxID=1093978 RepID=A0AAV4JGR8_9GAST|nr:methyltransferase-like protein 24 [Elysia marginata]